MATNTEKVVVQVIVKGGGQLDNLTKKTGRATKSAGGLTKGMAKMAGGVLAAAAAFRAIGKVITSSISTFKNFEFQMAKVKATTGATDKDFKKLTASAQQLGRTTFFTASKVGELQMNFAKLGFSTSEILDAQEATLRLATATGSDLARAAIVAGAAVRGFGLDASETERVVDVMAVAFTSSALDIEKWQTSMTKVAPIAAGANVSIESTAAIMGKLTDAGIEASIAGTSMRNIFLKMQDSSSDLSKHLGFTVNSSDDLERALTQLNSEALTNEEIMQLVDLRQVAAFATMVNGTDTIIDMTDALEDANGAAQDMADTMADTLQGDLITSQSAWEGFQLAIMNGSNNISKYLREGTQIWTFILNRWSDSLKDVDAVSADIFTNTIKAAKAATKEGNDLAKSSGNKGWATVLSRQLLEENKKLEGTLRAKGSLVEKSEKRIAELVGDGSGARRQWWAQEIAEEEEILKERLKIYNGTKLAIVDLTEEIEVQKKKEVAVAEQAALKVFAAGQQEIRNKAKIQREKEKIEDKRLSDIEKRNKEIEKKAKEKIKQEEGIRKQDNADTLKFLENTSNEYWNSLVNDTINGTGDIKDAEQKLADFQMDLINNLLLDESLSVEARAELDNQLTALKLDNYKKTTDASKKSDEDILEANKEMSSQKLEVMKAATDAIFTIMSGNLSKQTERESKKLEEKKDAGLITEEQYEEGVEAIQRKAFEKKKRLDIAQAIINGALAMTTVAGQTGILAFAFSPFIAAMTAAQIAIIASQKFAQGGMIEEFANGGLVQGKSHAQGGEKFAVGGRVVELEGGEAVINKRSTSMFSSQLSAMNAAGGGVKFADGGLLNQPSFSQQQFNALGQNQMMGAMGNSGKVIVVEADITNSQNTVSVIQSQATI